MLFEGAGLPGACAPAAGTAARPQALRGGGRRPRASVGQGQQLELGPAGSAGRGALRPEGPPPERGASAWAPKKGAPSAINECCPPAAELAQAYEVLRAQATGVGAPATPRGLVVFLAGGCGAWMSAWARPAPLPPVIVPPAGGPRLVLAGLSRALVRVLTELALGCQRWVPGES